MPVIILRNADETARLRLNYALTEEFPRKLGEICINVLLEPKSGEPYGYIQGSRDTDPAELEKIKEICSRFIEVRGREIDPSPAHYMIYYGMGRNLHDQISKNTCGMPVQWVPADPRLLNGKLAPYAEIHEDPDTSWITLDAINSLLDAEVYFGKEMTFHPRTNVPTV